jgi:hypothetical protein
MLPPLDLESVLTHGGKIRSKIHRNFVLQHLCIAWERKECRGDKDFCHAKDIAPSGHGTGKPSDEWGFVACRFHHDESEKREVAWGREMGIDVGQSCVEFAQASKDMRVRKRVPAMKDHLARMRELELQAVLKTHVGD